MRRSVAGRKAFPARKTALRRALLDEWNGPEMPFGMGYQKAPFPDVAGAV